MNDDHSAVSNYLGLVLAKPTAELAPAEKKQVRTLLRDNAEGEAQKTMTAWETIQSLKAKLEQNQDVMINLYEKMLSDGCQCGLSNCKVIVNEIK